MMVVMMGMVEIERKIEGKGDMVEYNNLYRLRISQRLPAVTLCRDHCSLMHIVHHLGTWRASCWGLSLLC
ncbi:hypothetical protein R1flu_022635 [Riccia fluitans]|uniref:Uncharacterized protein n=1 Tax=Riccia fluitans TaxID=41844 RepID=A0ABD1XPR9_9MARC